MREAFGWSLEQFLCYGSYPGSALLRRLFELGRSHSGQILSYTKMVGQLQDVGDTTTLAHYLDLLAGAGMITGLQKYSGNAVRRRASSPKLQVLNTALMTAQGRAHPGSGAPGPKILGAPGGIGGGRPPGQRRGGRKLLV